MLYNVPPSEEGTCSLMEILLNERQAAERLGLSQAFLNKHRQSGLGPPFCRVSSRCIRYRQEDLDKWVEERLVKSTSDIGLVT